MEARLLRRLFLLVGCAIILAPMFFSTAAYAQTPLDYELAVQGGAHFYSQANGSGGAGGTGYTVSNVDGIPFYNYFLSVGGVNAVGYPVSHRFIWNGFVVQAFQKVVFQWRYDTGKVAYVNVLDEMHNAGLDGALYNQRQVPVQSDWSFEIGQPFSTVAARHLDLLNA